MRPRNGAECDRPQAQSGGKVLKTADHKGDSSDDGIDTEYHNNQEFKQIQKPFGAQRVFDLHQHQGKHPEETDDGYNRCADNQIGFILCHSKHNEKQV